MSFGELSLGEMSVRGIACWGALQAVTRMKFPQTEVSLNGHFPKSHFFYLFESLFTGGIQK